MAVSIKNPDRNRFSVSVCRSLVPPHFKGGESDTDSLMQLSMSTTATMTQTAPLSAADPPTAGSPAAGYTTAALTAPKAVDNKNSTSAYICKFFVWLIFKGE